MSLRGPVGDEAIPWPIRNDEEIASLPGRPTGLSGGRLAALNRMVLGFPDGSVCSLAMTWWFPLPFWERVRVRVRSSPIHQLA